jgi:hypothetical protein
VLRMAGCTTRLPTIGMGRGGTHDAFRSVGMWRWPG